MKLLAALLLACLATPYPDVREIVALLGPAELKSADVQTFDAWIRERDASIRARLAQGELDSLVNMLLFGTSFTKQPRMTIENLAEESRGGLLRARLDDLLKGLASPGANERLVILGNVLAAKGYPPADPKMGSFILENLQRSLQEKIAIAAEVGAAQSPSNAFRERGVSLDTTIFPNYAMDAALAALARSDQLAPGRIARAAIVGPGLDLIDKEAGFDYYPLQTIQPFALQAALRRLKLAAPDQRTTILDISPRVIDHIKLALERESYIIQLPRHRDPNWTPELFEYWQTFGEGLATSETPLLPPAGYTARAVRFPAESVRSLDAADINIVTQRLELPDTGKFDLIVATNILVYYSPFEQALALANIAAMLKPGGVLLTNDRLPEIPNSPIRDVGSVFVTYSTDPRRIDTVYWYRRL